ncbi:MAG: hypothetical protein AAFU85_16260 [Planctomycetota bacterium]
MMYMIPWFVLMAVAVLALPIAAKMSPSAPSPASGGDDEAVLEDAPEPVMDDNFELEPMGGEAEPGNPDDAFADFG